METTTQPQTSPKNEKVEELIKALKKLYKLAIGEDTYTLRLYSSNKDKYILLIEKFEPDLDEYKEIFKKELSKDEYTELTNKIDDIISWVDYRLLIEKILLKLFRNGIIENYNITEDIKIISTEGDYKCVNPIIKVIFYPSNGIIKKLKQLKREVPFYVEDDIKELKKGKPYILNFNSQTCIKIKDGDIEIDISKETAKNLIKAY